MVAASVIALWLSTPLPYAVDVLSNMVVDAFVATVVAMLAGVLAEAKLNVLVAVVTDLKFDMRTPSVE